MSKSNSLRPIPLLGAVALGLITLGFGGMRYGWIGPEDAGPDNTDGSAATTQASLDALQTCPELLQWIAEHREAFLGRIELSGAALDLQYRPAICQACIEDPEGALTDTQLLARIEELRDMDLYVLRSELKENEERDDPLTGLTDASFIEVIGTDSLPCTFFHIEPVSPGLPYRSAIIGFDHAQDAQARKLIVLGSGTERNIQVAFDDATLQAMAQAAHHNEHRP